MKLLSFILITAYSLVGFTQDYDLQLLDSSEMAIAENPYHFHEWVTALNNLANKDVLHKRSIFTMKLDSILWTTTQTNKLLKVEYELGDKEEFHYNYIEEGESEWRLGSYSHYQYNIHGQITQQSNHALSDTIISVPPLSLIHI